MYNANRQTFHWYYQKLAGTVPRSTMIPGDYYDISILADPRRKYVAFHTYEFVGIHEILYRFEISFEIINHHQVSLRVIRTG